MADSPTPAELREESRRLREASRKELNPALKRELAQRALELALQAERMEREAAAKSKASSADRS